MALALALSTLADATLLFHHPSAAPLARRVVDADPSAVRLGGCSWQAFEDGFPNLTIDAADVEAIENGAECAFLACLDTPAAVFGNMALIYALAQLGARHFRVLVPFFATGTMERVDAVGQVATAAAMARILSATPHCGSGPSTVVVYDVHALQEQFYFSDNVHVQLKSAVPLLHEKLAELAARPGGPAPVVVYPDDGSAKRFAPRLAEYESVRCSKVRDGDARVVAVKEGEAAGRHCVIVDDLARTGGTLIECARALKAAGAAAVSAFVVHAVFPDESWRQFCDEEGLFEHVWVTDTVGPVAEELLPPFEVLSIAPLLSKLLRGADPAT